MTGGELSERGHDARLGLGALHPGIGQHHVEGIGRAVELVDEVVERSGVVGGDEAHAQWYER